MLRLAGWRSVGVKSMKDFQVEERNADSLTRKLEVAHKGNVRHCTRLEREVGPWWQAVS